VENVHEKIVRVMTRTRRVRRKRRRRRRSILRCIPLEGCLFWLVILPGVVSCLRIAVVWPADGARGLTLRLKRLRK
jgi:hypothetical protein